MFTKMIRVVPWRSIQRCGGGRQFWGRPHIGDEINRAVRHVERDMRAFEREMTRFYDEFDRFRPFSRWPRFRDDCREVAEDGSRQLSIKVDMSQYKPEQVKVTVRDNMLTIQAKHEEISKDGSKVYQEYVRQYSLPEDVQPETIRSLLDADGMLTIEGRLPAVEASKTKEIPVEHQPSKQEAKN